MSLEENVPFLLRDAESWFSVYGGFWNMIFQQMGDMLCIYLK